MVVVLDPSDSADLVISWDDIGSATLSSVTYPAIAGLTLQAGTIVGATSRVRVSGLAHGRTYQIEAQATLSTGEILNRNIAVRAFNG